MKIDTKPIEIAQVTSGYKPNERKTSNKTYIGQVTLQNGQVEDCFLKDLDVHELSYELLTCALATFLNLDVPKCYVALVEGRESDFPNCPRQDSIGVIFASKKLPGPSLVPDHNVEPSGQSEPYKRRLQEMSGWSGLAGLYFLDNWMANEDRNLGNIIALPGKKFSMIDHGRMFTGPKRCFHTKEQYHFMRLERWLSPALLAPAKSRVVEGVEKLSQTATKVCLDKAVQNSLIDEIENGVDSEVLKDFLAHRLKHTVAFTKKSLGLAA